MYERRVVDVETMNNGVQMLSLTGSANEICLLLEFFFTGTVRFRFGVNFAVKTASEEASNFREKRGRNVLDLAQDMGRFTDFWFINTKTSEMPVSGRFSRSM